MMSFIKFTYISAGAGLLVPLMFRAVWYFINQHANIKTQIIVEKLMLLLWPTSLMTLPSSPDPNFEVKLFIISLVSNILVYAIFGALIWLGLRKHVSFLAIAGFLLIALWYWLLSL